MSLTAFFATFGYVNVFLLVFLINVIPAFMPPTWLVLSTLYFLFPQYFNPILLVITGAFAATLGRVVLARMGFASRRVMGDDRKRSMDDIGNILRSKKYGGFLLSLLFALSPLPSNFYFIALGMIDCQFFSIFLGFWLGRLISYWILISITHVVFRSLAEIFSSQIQSIIIVNLLGILSMIIFAIIDWDKLIRERRLAFIRPRFFNNSK